MSYIYQPISSADFKRLHEMRALGLLPSLILKDIEPHKDIPTMNVINSWLYADMKAKPSQLQWVLKACDDYLLKHPEAFNRRIKGMKSFDANKINWNSTQSRNLRLKWRRTQKPIEKLWALTKDAPEGLTLQRVQSLLNPTITGYAEKEHIDFLEALFDIHSKKKERIKNAPKRIGSQDKEEQLKKPIYHTICAANLKKLQEMRELGLLPSRILKDVEPDKNIPTANMIKNWLSRAAKSADPKKLQWVLKACDDYLASNLDYEYELYQPISDADFKRLHEMKTLGLIPSFIIKDGKLDKDFPTISVIKKWLSKTVTKAKPIQVQRVLNACDDYLARNPDYEYELYQPISEKDLNRLHEMKALGLLPSRILKGIRSHANIPTVSIISSWLNQTVKKAKPIHLQWVLKACEDYRAQRSNCQNESYLPISKTDFERLQEMRTLGLLPSLILKDIEPHKDIPTASMIKNWLSRAAKNADPKKLQWVLKACDDYLVRNPDYQNELYKPISDADFKRLHEMQALGLIPRRILRGVKSCAIIPTSRIIENWLSQKVKNAKPHHLQWVLKACDDYLLKYPEILVDGLKSIQDLDGNKMSWGSTENAYLRLKWLATGKSIEKLWLLAKNAPKGLTLQRVQTLLDPTITGYAEKEHIDFLEAFFEKHSKRTPKPKKSQIPPEKIEKLRKEHERTNYTIARVIRMKGRNDVNTGNITSLLQGKVKTSVLEHVDYLIQAYAELPDYQKPIKVKTTD